MPSPPPSRDLLPTQLEAGGMSLWPNTLKINVPMTAQGRRRDEAVVTKHGVVVASRWLELSLPCMD